MPIIEEKSPWFEQDEILQNPGWDLLQVTRCFSNISHPDFERIANWKRRNPSSSQVSKSNYKSYPGSEIAALNPKLESVECRLVRALTDRKTSRDLSSGSITLEVLSNLLVMAYGENESRRTVASAGGLYPIEIYAWARNVDGLKRGYYHFNIRTQTLELVSEDRSEQDLGWYFSGGTPEGCPADVPIVLFLTGIPERTLQKYGSLGWRLFFMDAGHVSQNFYLSASGLSLGIWPSAICYEDRILPHLRVDGLREVLLLSMFIGRAK